MSISQLFPEEGPTLNLNFAGSRTLDPRITFTRTSTGTYMGSDGLIKVAPADSPRFDHRYVNGEIESLGLLVEEQRSNLITYSEDFDTWTKPGTPAGASISQDVTISPDGSNTADKIVESNTTGGHGIWLGFTLPQTTTYTFSVFLKADERTWVDVRAYNSTNGNQFIAKIDLENGDFLENTGGTVSLDPFSNGWWRFSGVCSFDNIYTQFFIAPIISNNDASDTSYTGDGSSGIYVWGAQLEQGSFPTSYIPRPDASTATRNPDNVSMVGENFSSWYNPTEGTIVLDCTPVYDNSSNQYRRLLSIHNNSGGQTDVIQFIQTEASNQVSSAVWDGSSFQSGFGKVVNSGTRYKVAFAVKENNMNASYDGSIGTDDTSATLPVMTEMDIGSYNNVYQATTHYNSLRYYPTRLPNSQLQTLTR